MNEDQREFGRRIRIARIWAGHDRQSTFGLELSKRWPDWPVRTNVRRVETGERLLSFEERQVWAERVAEATGVPEWFLISGWEGATQNKPIEDQLDELRQSVERHNAYLLESIRHLPPPFPEEPPAKTAATTLRRAAQGARQKQDERPGRKPASRRDRKS